MTLALSFLALGGRGTIKDVVEGPRIYGGVRQDIVWTRSMCTAGMGVFDFPFSAVLDTALLPVTVAFALTK